MRLKAESTGDELQVASRRFGSWRLGLCSVRTKWVRLVILVSGVHYCPIIRYRAALGCSLLFVAFAGFAVGGGF